MSEIWEKLDTWIHVKKAIILLVAIILFYPLVYLILIPIIGIYSSIIIYFLYLFFVGYIIRVKIREEDKIN